MLKPLDFQTIMPRTVDLQRIQQITNSRPIVGQQETLQEAIKLSQQRQEQILQNEASAAGNRTHVDNDEQNSERRYRRRYGKKKNSAIENEQPEQAVDSERGQHIDIKL